MQLDSSSHYKPSSKEVDAWVSRVSEINEAVTELLRSDPKEDLERLEARKNYRKEWEAQQQKARMDIVKMRYEPKYYGRYENDNFIDELMKKVDEDSSVQGKGKARHRDPLVQDPSLFSKAERLSLEEAYRLKEEGLQHMQKGQWEMAYKVYNGALQLGVEELDELLAIKLRNNRACVLNKLGRYREVCEDATYVLQREPSNVKALLRRAWALRYLHRPVEALKDVSQALRLEPRNSEGLRLRTWLERTERELLLSDRFVDETKTSFTCKQNPGRIIKSTSNSEICNAVQGAGKMECTTTPSDTLKAAGEFLSTSSLEQLLQDPSLLEKTFRIVEQYGVGAAVWFALHGGVASSLTVAARLLQELKELMLKSVPVSTCMNEDNEVTHEIDTQDEENNMACSSISPSSSDDVKVAHHMPESFREGIVATGGSTSSVVPLSKSREERFNTIYAPLVYCLRLLSVLFDGCETVSQDVSEASVRCLIQHLILFVFPTFFRIPQTSQEHSSFTRVFNASLECLTTLFEPYGNILNSILEQASGEDIHLPMLWNTICRKMKNGAGKSLEVGLKKEKDDHALYLCTVLHFSHFLSACLKGQGNPINVKEVKEKKKVAQSEEVALENAKKVEKGNVCASSLEIPSPLIGTMTVAQQLYLSATEESLTCGSKEGGDTISTSAQMIMQVVEYCLQRQMPLPILSAGVELALQLSTLQVFILSPSSSSSLSGSAGVLTASDTAGEKKLVALEWRNKQWVYSLCSAFSEVMQTCCRSLSSSTSLSSEKRFLEAFYSLLYNLCLAAPDRSTFVKEWESLCRPLTVTQLSWEYVQQFIQFCITNSIRRKHDNSSSKRGSEEVIDLMLSSAVLPKLMGVLGKFVFHSAELQRRMSSSIISFPIIFSSRASISKGSCTNIDGSSNSSYPNNVESPDYSLTEELSPLWVLLYRLCASNLTPCTAEGDNRSRWELLEYISTTLAVLVRLQRQAYTSAVEKEEIEKEGSTGNVVVTKASCPGNIHTLLCFLPICLPPTEEKVLLWKEFVHAPGHSPSYSNTSHLTMPLIALGNIANLIEMIMDIFSGYRKQSTYSEKIHCPSSFGSSPAAEDYDTLVKKVLKEKDAVGILLHSLRAARSSALMLARERADAERKKMVAIVPQLRVWEEHTLVTLKNLAIAVSKVVGASDDMRIRLRELNGLETLAAVLQQTKERTFTA